MSRRSVPFLALLSLQLVACGSDPEAGGGAGASGTATYSGGAGGDVAAAGSGSCTLNLGCKLYPPPTTGDIRQDCVDRINQFRAQCACLPPLERWTAAEACADQMAMHDSVSNKPHAGFSGRICSPGGNGQNECPGYPSEQVVIGGCLQQMWAEGPPPGPRCEGACFQQHGHFINMTNPQWKRVACGFQRTAAGEIWSVQNYSP